MASDRTEAGVEGDAGLAHLTGQPRLATIDSWDTARGNDDMVRQWTAIIQPEGSGFVSHCPELDVASQGDTAEQARDSLRDALELFFECASPSEVERRLRAAVTVTQVETTVG